nr:hypothetical protein CFP56_36427 [Quercus suber]
MLASLSMHPCSTVSRSIDVAACLQHRKAETAPVLWPCDRPASYIHLQPIFSIWRALWHSSISRNSQVLISEAFNPLHTVAVTSCSSIHHLLVNATRGVGMVQASVASNLRTSGEPAAASAALSLFVTQPPNEHFDGDLVL